MHKKMRCEKFVCKRNWSWLAFGLAIFGGLGFFALVAKLVNKWSYGFCAIFVGNSHKCIKNEVWKIWLQKVLIWLGFGLAKFGGLVFFALVAKLVNKWSYGFCEILVGNCHKCIKMRCEKFGCKRNWSLLRFGLAKFGGLAFFAFHKCLKNEVWKVWLQKEFFLVGFGSTNFGGLAFFCLGSKIGE